MTEPIEIRIRKARQNGACDCDLLDGEFETCTVGRGERLDPAHEYRPDKPGPRCPGPGTYVLVEKDGWNGLKNDLFSFMGLGPQAGKEKAS